MKAMLKKATDGDLEYECLMFICPGCEVMGAGSTGLHMLPVRRENKEVVVGKVTWLWDGNLERPTLSPSILTRSGLNGEQVCHSFLIEGVFQFLPDCTHSFKGTHKHIGDLPDWVM